ncbi:MAG: nitrous oxide-stimulated promoter family protein [Syntrophaceae bacterium]|nr:nitrous oxide-stimulated promoter family protein [Syntrophaceae bacterium]
MKNRFIKKEYKTIEAMAGLYCRGLHGTDKKQLCADCEELLAYVKARLDKCPYQEQKPTCAKCPIHCYKPAMREKVRSVMRYAGPRMLKHHPLLAIRHLLHGRREAPPPRKG